MPVTEVNTSKPPRSFSEIQTEYQGLCTKAGHLNYQLFTLNKDLAMVNDTLRDLNLEAAAAKEAETKAAEAAKESNSNA